MTALFRHLDRLEALRTAEAPAEDPAARLQAASEALYGEPLRADWLAQVLRNESAEPVALASLGESESSYLPRHEHPQPEAAVAQALARATDPQAFFPEVTLEVLTVNPDSLNHVYASMEAPTPTGWRPHYRPRSGAVRDHTLLQIKVWQVKELLGRAQRHAGLMLGTGLFALAGMTHLLHAAGTSAGLAVGASALLGWGLSRRTRYLPADSEARQFALELAEDWTPALLDEEDLARAQAHPELAQAVHTWATSDAGLLQQDLVELRWRHKHLSAARRHAAHVATLAPRE